MLLYQASLSPTSSWKLRACNLKTQPFFFFFFVRWAEFTEAATMAKKKKKVISVVFNIYSVLTRLQWTVESQAISNLSENTGDNILYLSQGNRNPVKILSVDRAKS